ncbi:MAG: PD40 domain-containing protein [bacterium]|nr:MAG: PD40 domain-containing protein [bacterium]
MRFRSLIVLAGAVSLLIAGTACCGKEESTPSQSRYFGLKPPGMKPEVFAPGVVSTEAWEASGTFSPDLKEYFFTRRPDFEGTDNRLMYMRYEDGEWTEPQLAPFAKDYMEFEPFIMPDGNRLYFNSKRPDPESGSTKDRIWYADKTKDGWSEANLMDKVINSGWAMYVTGTRDGTLYFTGMYDKRYGIFRSRLVEGRYKEPEYLPKEINGVYGASHPFVAPDESYVMFDGQPGGPGKTDLYISFRSENDKWSKARKLGPEINATKTENCASVSPDGKYMFFYRDSDIYWVDAAVIEEAKNEKND